MAIRCSGCGREYDVTLFQFGRTIHCTCGTRVGLESRVGPTLAGKELRFFADAMLGGLARWLRILGFDTEYDPEIADGDLVRRSLEEGRRILTRDRRLPEEWRVSSCLVLRGEEAEEQLREVLEAFPLAQEMRLFSRCTLCNTILNPISRDRVRDEVPPRVLEANATFAACPDCGQIYWEGTHAERIRRRLERVLGEGV